MPHTGRAQIGPVTSTTVQKTTPTSAETMAKASTFGLRFTRYATEATRLTKKSRNAVHADGTW